MVSLLKAIGAVKLTEYFEFLDARASNYQILWLMHEYPGMARPEAVVIVSAWRDTLNEVLPMEDRVRNALEAESV